MPGQLVFVGIDQALRKIGLCILQPNITPQLILIKPPRNMRGPQRLTFLKQAVYTHLHPFDTCIARAAIEAQSYGSSGDLDQLGQINGVIQVVLTELDAPPLMVPPTVLKKFVTGNGQANKKDMRQATQKYWNFDIDQDDLCDAHGLAQFACEVHLAQSSYRHHIETVHRFLHKKPKRPRLKKLFKETF